ncbi:TPA: fimbrial protein [Enterobacter chengduensis]
MKKKALVLLLLSLSSSAKDHGKGEVSVNGQIQESACNIHLDDVFQSLFFDNVKVSHIVNDDEDKAKNFTIRLINCSAEKSTGGLWESVHISFDGTPDRQNGDLFLMSGEGSGVAVQIKDTNGQRVLP